MATIDVTDDNGGPNGGATGDGTTDDSDDIQAAIDSAANGDTVYFPAGTYILDTANTSTNDPHPLFVDGTYPNNITLEGDAHDQSILKFADGFTDGGTINMLLIEPNDGLTGWLIQRLGFDGNKANNSNTGNMICTTVGRPNATGVTDISYKNVEAFNPDRHCFQNYADGVSYERCTARGADEFQGWALADGDDPTIGNISLKYCYSANNGGNNIDSSGSQGVLVEDCVSEGSGTAGTKIGGNGYSTTYRRVRIINPTSSGLSSTNTGGQGVDPENQTITVEDMVVDGAGRHGFRFGRGHHWDCSTGAIVAKNCNTDSGNNGGGLYFTDDNSTGTDVTINDMRAYDSQNGATGFGSDATGTLSFGTYSHDGNAGGAGDTTVVTNNGGTVNTNRDLDIAGVPTASEVGAGSATTTTSTVSGLDVNGGALTVRSGGSLGVGAPPSTTQTVYPTTSSGWTDLGVSEPTHYWACEETSGTTFADQIGTQDMSLSGVALGATGINGSNAGDYDAANNDYGEATGANVNTTGYAFAFWINFSSFEDFGRPIQTAPPGNIATDGWEILEWDAGLLRLRHWSGGTSDTVMTSATGLTAGTWYFVCGGSNGTKDDGILRIYDRDSANGLLESATGVGVRATSASESLTVMNGDNNLGYTGVIDEVLTWTTELTTTEFDTLYDQGSI